MSRAPKGKYNSTLLQTIIDRDLCTIDLENYVKVTCETIIVFTCICGNQHQKSFQHLYERSALCNVCIKKKASDKRNTNNFEKYGAKSTLQIPDTREKTKQTNLLKYGTENVFQNAEIQEKIKATNLEKYGSEYVTQNPEIRGKIKATNLIKYGTETPAQNADVQEKTKQTNMIKYGTESHLQNPENSSDKYNKIWCRKSFCKFRN